MPQPEAVATVDAQAQLRGLTLLVKVKGRRRALWRTRVAAWLVEAAAVVLGGAVELEAEFDR